MLPAAFAERTASLTSKDRSYFTYRTPHGPITIGVAGGAISDVALGNVALQGECRPTEISNACATELLEYFAGKRMAFDLPVAPEGTAFQKAVWHAIGAIPYGQTRTYAEIAEAVGKPDSYRMVGAAVKKNPVVALIPAHRVVGANGKPAGTDKHAQLRAAFLELERRNA